MKRPDKVVIKFEKFVEEVAPNKYERKARISDIPYFKSRELDNIKSLNPDVIDKGEYYYIEADKQGKDVTLYLYRHGVNIPFLYRVGDILTLAELQRFQADINHCEYLLEKGMIVDATEEWQGEYVMHIKPVGRKHSRR